MKLLHLADLHIGKVINEFSMLEDQKYILNQVISIARDEKTEGVILAGDIYDRSVPTADAVLVLDDFLRQLIKLGQKVFVISGNHDSPERIGFAGEILEKGGLFMEGGFFAALKQVSLSDEYGRVNLYFMPFSRVAAMQKVLGMEAGCTMTDCIRQVIKNTKIDSSQRNILITHHFITGGGSTLKLSDSEYPVSVGGTENVDASVFDCFDYVALGHIHRPQSIGRDAVCYAGSPLKYSFSECEAKSAVLLELKEKGSLSISRRPLKPLHDMRKIKGSLKELLKEEVVSLADPEDYLHVTLTDEKELFEPMEALRSRYPNVMQLELLKNIRQEGEKAVRKQQLRKKSLMEIYEDFYEEVTDRSLNEEQKQVLNAVISGIEEERL
ncbi:MAG: exonuclease SbcCD subunit D [Acetivibrio ethanolgignens]